MLDENTKLDELKKIKADTDRTFSTSYDSLVNHISCV